MGALYTDTLSSSDITWAIKAEIMVSVNSNFFRASIGVELFRFVAIFYTISQKQVEALLIIFIKKILQEFILAGRVFRSACLKPSPSLG